MKVTFSDEAARAIARDALMRKVGARGLRMIIEELMLDLINHVLGNEKVKEITITEAMVKNRDLALRCRFSLRKLGKPRIIGLPIKSEAGLDPDVSDPYRELRS